MTSADRKNKQKLVPDIPGEANQCVNSFGLTHRVHFSLLAGVVLENGVCSVMRYRGKVKH